MSFQDFEKATDPIIGGLKSNKIMSKEEREDIVYCYVIAVDISFCYITAIDTVYCYTIAVDIVYVMSQP